MAGGIVKYLNRQASLAEPQADGSTVFWGRAAEDGLPFRATKPVGPMREEEYQQRQTVTLDAQVRVHNLANPRDRRRHEVIVDHVANQLWTLFYHRIRFFSATKIIAVTIYAKQYIELGPSPGFEGLTPVGRAAPPQLPRTG